MKGGRQYVTAPVIRRDAAGELELALPPEVPFAEIHGARDRRLRALGDGVVMGCGFGAAAAVVNVHPALLFAASMVGLYALLRAGVAVKEILVAARSDRRRRRQEAKRREYHELVKAGDALIGMAREAVRRQEGHAAAATFYRRGVNARDRAAALRLELARAGVDVGEPPEQTLAVTSGEDLSLPLVEL